jgi:hypothetical protein
MGWQGTAMTLGAAVGAPLCGWFIDRHGAGAGFLTASAIGVVLAGGGLLVLRLARDRSLRSASPAEPARDADEAHVPVDARG